MYETPEKKCSFITKKILIDITPNVNTANVNLCLINDFIKYQNYIIAYHFVANNESHQNMKIQFHKIL